MARKKIFLAFILVLLFFAHGCRDKPSGEKLSQSDNIEKPSPASGSETSFAGKIKNFFTGEKLSPYDHIKKEQIHVYDDKVVIDIKRARWVEFEDTNSMDPLLDVGANAIQIIPESEEDIHLGDIVVYDSDFYGGSVIHRVVNINEDEKGKYFILKGDNNPVRDPENVRFGQIKRVLVGIIY